MTDGLDPKIDYGLDAPGAVRFLALAGLVVIPLGLALATGRIDAGRLLSAHGAHTLAVAVLATGCLCWIEGLWMIFSSRVGKLTARDRLLDRLGLRGSEALLDVGCGRGLLLIGAAKRLPAGRAFGVDLWSLRDQSHNSREATLANAALAGVSDRVEVIDGDMRGLPFPDGRFDAVVSSFAIHNVREREGRRRALREIARVTKPGGRVALQDLARSWEYAEELREAGFTNVARSGATFWVFPPARTVTATKPD